MYETFKSSLSRACAACLLLFASSLAAQEPAPLRSLEDAIETSTEAVLLPSTVPGSLTFRNCTEPCATRTLEISSDTRFFVGNTSVPLREFNAYVARTGAQFLMVFYQPGGRVVTRLMVFGELQQ